MGKYENICRKPWEELVVYSDCQYSVCCGGLPVGKIEKPEDVDNLWNNKIVKRYRENLKKGKLEGICKDCVFAKLRNISYVEEERDVCDFSKIPILSPNPKIISFGPTEKCNLKCFMCGFTEKYAGRNRMKDAESLPADILERIGERYFNGLEQLNTNCFGEIFLYEHLNLLLELIKKSKIGYVYSSTNGSLNLSEEKWSEIMETHHQMNFSVDSTDRDVHKIVRGFDMDKVFENLEIIKRLKETEFPNFVLSFSMVIMKITMHDMFNLVRTAHEEWGAEVVSFQHLWNLDHQKLCFEKEWRSFYNNQLRKIEEYLKTYPGVKLNDALGYFRDDEGNIE